MTTTDSNAQTSSRKFAVFDIDGTLIRWQMMHAIVGDLARKGVLGPGVAEQIRHERMIWKSRSADNSFQTYEKALVRIYHDAIQGVAVDDYTQSVNTIFNEYKDQVYTYTRDLIHQLKSEGYFLLTISGSQQEIITLIAEHYGFDASIGCTFEQKDGLFTGSYNTRIFDKDKALQELVVQHDLTYSGSIGVGDSESDIVLLEAVEHPIAFNPSSGLYKVARAAGWEIIIERKSVIYNLQSKDGQYILA